MPVLERSPETDATIEHLRSVLGRANYTEQGIRGLGIDIGLGVRAGDIPYLSRALAPDEPLSMLVRLFLLRAEVRAVELRRTTGLDAQALARLGILERRAERVRASVDVTPWAGLVVAHDPDPEGPLWGDHVTGPNPAAETLGQLTVRSQVRRALDLGTGSGLFALLAARHAEGVIATDVNPRALWFTALNARLNGLTNVETRHGSFFEPVSGSRFDLIVSNPPFVISPETADVFRHSPLPRDEVSGTVVREAARHLDEGGFAHVLCNWIQAAGGDWRSTLAQWVEGTGCDALLLHHGTEDPLAYAARWNTRLQYVAPESYAGTLDRWLAYHRKERIEAIGSGAVILRRREASANWVHGLELSFDSRGECGRHIVGIFAAQDHLARLEDETALLAGTFRLADRHRLDQSLVFRGDRYVIQAASLVLEEGLGVRGLIEPDLAGVLFRLDGTLTLGQVVAAVAAEGGGDAAAVGPRAIRLVRHLLELGFAEPLAESEASS